MSLGEIKRLGGGANAVVVQLPERQFPGVVIQHDSLKNLHSMVCELRDALAAGDPDEAEATIDGLDDILAGYLAAFPDRAS